MISDSYFLQSAGAWHFAGVLVAYTLLRTFCIRRLQTTPAGLLTRLVLCPRGDAESASPIGTMRAFRASLVQLAVWALARLQAGLVLTSQTPDAGDLVLMMVFWLIVTVYLALTRLSGWAPEMRLMKVEFVPREIGKTR